MLNTAHKECVRRANLVNQMLYELDQCGLEYLAAGLTPAIGDDVDR